MARGSVTLMRVAAVLLGLVVGVILVLWLLLPLTKVKE